MSGTVIQNGHTSSYSYLLLSGTSTLASRCYARSVYASQVVPDSSINSMMVSSGDNYKVLKPDKIQSGFGNFRREQNHCKPAQA